MRLQRRRSRLIVLINVACEVSPNPAQEGAGMCLGVEQPLGTEGRPSGGDGVGTCCPAERSRFVKDSRRLSRPHVSRDRVLPVSSQGNRANLDDSPLMPCSWMTSFAPHFYTPLGREGSVFREMKSQVQVQLILEPNSHPK